MNGYDEFNFKCKVNQKFLLAHYKSNDLMKSLFIDEETLQIILELDY